MRCAVWSRNLISSSWNLRNFDNKGNIWTCDRKLIYNYFDLIGKWNAFEYFKGLQGRYIVRSIILYARMKKWKIYRERERKSSIVRVTFFILFRHFDPVIEKGRLKVSSFKISKIRKWRSWFTDLYFFFSRIFVTCLNTVKQSTRDSSKK